MTLRDFYLVALLLALCWTLAGCTFEHQHIPLMPGSILDLLGDPPKEAATPK